MNLLEKANQIAIAKLQKENQLMKQLSSRQGFFKYYYGECKHHETNKAAFDAVNEQYYELFGAYRFSDYASFKSITTYYNKNKNA